MYEVESSWHMENNGMNEVNKWNEKMAGFACTSRMVFFLASSLCGCGFVDTTDENSFRVIPAYVQFTQ